MADYNANLFNIPRPRDPPTHSTGPQVSVLPLNLIALIISHLDNVADLARVCQTSRVLHYMTLPQLYRNMTLISYDTIRYKNELAEGIGSASPFSMGLNALVTRSVCTLVRALALQGQWREHDLKEYSQAGRVPDDTMMLNIAVRAAVDRCTHLESFRWDLSTKLLPNVYAGLANLHRLENFHLRCPTGRSPRPIAELPPMPNLRSFTMTDYDPLCFPDDISTLLLQAGKLEALKMHFSPRMRDVGEPSVQLLYFFRKNISAKRQLKLKTIGIYNVFAYHNAEEIALAIDIPGIENVTFLNTFGVDEDSGQPASAAASAGFLTFFDSSWIRPPGKIVLKSMRHDRLSKFHAKGLGEVSGLERLYLTNARHQPPIVQNGTENGHPNAEPSPLSIARSTPPNSSISNSSRSTPIPTSNLRDLYIESICTNHGPTLRHLILPARWPLPTSIVARLFRSCPHITQLAMGIESESSLSGMRMLVPFLKKLWAIRLLAPNDGNEALMRKFECMSEHKSSQEELMEQELARGGDFPELKFVGIGLKVWEIGGLYEEDVMVEREEGERQETVLKRRLRRLELEDVKEVEIWKMDTLDVV